jgi:regulator of CtrA degradation
MTELTRLGQKPVTDRSLTPEEMALARRILDFARSEMFERTFKEGMGLVEQTAAYLDGPGRAASKRLSRTAALAYAGESMRLTTRLMQVASWLLVQRAVREGEMTLNEARSEKFRFANRDPKAQAFAGLEDLPGELTELMKRSESIYERVRRIDADMYEQPPAALAPVGAAAQLARLQQSFGE